MKDIKLKLSILASLLVLLLMPNITNAEENKVGESINSPVSSMGLGDCSSIRDGCDS